MSAIISCWLMRRTRWCLLLPSAVVSPGCSQRLQPQSRRIGPQRTKVRVKNHKAKFLIPDFWLFGLVQFSITAFLLEISQVRSWRVLLI
jgi:hypothetical protein